MSRRRLLGAAGALAGLHAVAGCALLLPDAGPGVGGGPLPTGTPEPAPPRVLPPLDTVRGTDLSSTPRVEAAGWRFADRGRTAAVEELLAAHGANVVRLRLWVDPPPGINDLPTTLALARRARNAGCHVLLDLHYADTWADPFRQPTPAAWRGLDLDRLAAEVRGYTRSVLTAFAAQDTPPALVQIGNEVSAGLLWPVGHVQDGTRAEWNRLAALIGAGIRGARDAGVPGLRTVVHTDTGGDADRSGTLFSNLVRRGVEPDVLAVSYFPWWHGPLDNLETNLHRLAAAFGRPVLVAETSYPWCVPAAGTPGVDVPRLYVHEARRLPEPGRYPPTPSGQAAFLHAVRAAVDGVPQGLGLGVVVWEPAWMPWVPTGTDQPNRVPNHTLFDWSGAGLPGLAVLRP